MSRESEFEGQVAIVTGASSGIGEWICRILSSAGASVVGIDRQTPTNQPPWEVAQADVSDADSVERVVGDVVRKHGRIDALFNNAGVASTTSVVDCTPEEWDRVMAVNARGVFLGIRAVVPHMLAQGGGVVVNTASVLGFTGIRDRAAYCASKGAVIALTKQVAIQYVRDGIRCNAVAPGTVDSPWVEQLLAGADDPHAARQQLIDRQPIGRLGTPDEIAHAAVFLASPAVSYMTGTILTVDGGIVAGI